MFAKFDLDSVRFLQPEYLWLLIAPGALLLIWVWQFTARRRAASCQHQTINNTPGAISSHR